MSNFKTSTRFSNVKFITITCQFGWVGSPSRWGWELFGGAVVGVTFVPHQFAVIRRSPPGLYRAWYGATRLGRFDLASHSALGSTDCKEPAKQAKYLCCKKLGCFVRGCPNSAKRSKTRRKKSNLDWVVAKKGWWSELTYSFLYRENSVPTVGNLKE